MKNLFYNRKLVVSIFVVLILVLTAVAIGPIVYSLFKSGGVKTEPVTADGAKAASTPLDGSWSVAKGRADNHTSVGFTFDEVLPAERTSTSGSTTEVTGQAEISDSTLESATITVNMDALTTDKKVRDQNMKSKLFKTSSFPESSFTLTKPASLADVPEDGTIGSVKLTGDLTIKDKTQEITHEFDVLRDGDDIVIGGDVPINRLDYNVETPDMLAAKVAEDGEINLRISLNKD